MLTLKNTVFEVDEEQSRFYIEIGDNQHLRFSLDIICKDGEYESELCNPCVMINSFDTQALTVQDLVGLEVVVQTLEESDEREDMFYLFEHEPFVEYTLNILQIEDENVHVHLKGIAVIDGYADPFIKAPFEADCWLRIR
jgi:hypothetical protein